MKVEVQKYLFIGPASEQAAFFQTAQTVGIVQFIPPESRVPEALPSAIVRLTEAIKILKLLPPQKEADESQNQEEALAVAERVIHARRMVETLLEEQRLLHHEIQRIEVFGDFSPSRIADLEKETGRQIQFFNTSKADVIEAPKQAEVLYVGSNHGLDYFIAFNKERRLYQGMNEMQIERSLGEVQHGAQIAAAQLHKFEQALHQLLKYLPMLRDALLTEWDKFHLQAAESAVLHYSEQKLFAVEGWVPKNQIDKLEKLVQTHDVYVEQVAIRPDERVPTYLHNKGFARIGQDIVSVYDTPSTTDRDPSAWVFWVFSFFFAMIIGDAGYGLIYLALSGWLLYRFRKTTGVGKRFLKLCTTIGLFCVLWGIFIGAYFGLALDVKHPLRAHSGMMWIAERMADYHFTHHDPIYQEYLKDYPSLAETKSSTEFLFFKEQTATGQQVVVYDSIADRVMMELALLIGVVHLLIGMVREAHRRWPYIGWMIAMIGGYLYFPKFLGVTSIVPALLGLPVSTPEIGLQLMFGGMIVAVILAFIQSRWMGLLEPMNVVQIFADVMSYLRLYALGLAGGMMAATFNEMGSRLGLVVGLVIIVAGHAVNLVLSIMGGVIHGLRLNFVEWYRYCFEGGGKEFAPLSSVRKINE